MGYYGWDDESITNDPEDNGYIREEDQYKEIVSDFEALVHELYGTDLFEIEYADRMIRRIADKLNIDIPNELPKNINAQQIVKIEEERKIA